MTAEIYLLAAVLFGLISAALLVVTLRVSARIHQVTQERLSTVLKLNKDAVDDSPAHKLERCCNRLGLHRLHKLTGASLRTLLDQAGIYRPELRAVVHGVYALCPFAFAGLLLLYVLATGDLREQGASALAFGALFGYFAPRYALRYLGGVRKRHLCEETLVMIHLLEMLFEAGLSIEQALRTLRDQARALMPHMCGELDKVIARIEAGMDRVLVLEQWGRGVGLREVSDLVEMLAQVSTQGGNLRRSLAELVVLMEDRSRTELREKVGKLSGKMTLVMVLFLFPALMIFVAGPGVMSLSAALGGLQ